MKQQTNNPQSTTAVPMQDVSVNLKVPAKTFHCLKSTGSHFTRTFFKISAYTITDIMHILNKSASWYISFELSGLLAEYPISTLTIVFMHVTYISTKSFQKF
jgi:hypothetical protein